MNNDSEFSALAQALASISFDDTLPTERRLKYNIETGEYRIEDADTVHVDEVWDENYMVISQDTALPSPVIHRIIDGKITWIDTSISTFWHETPQAEVLENNPYFCIRELEEEVELEEMKNAND